jgi:hypothetical protein
MVIERVRVQVIHRYRNPGDAAVAGAASGPKAQRTFNVLSSGDTFPKRIETKSALVALAEESPFGSPPDSGFADGVKNT